MEMPNSAPAGRRTDFCQNTRTTCVNFHPKNRALLPSKPHFEGHKCEIIYFCVHFSRAAFHVRSKTPDIRYNVNSAETTESACERSLQNPCEETSFASRFCIPTH